MRKAADLYPGRSKTDARGAFIIADTARTMPHTLRQVDRDSEVLSALKLLTGFDEDLAHETTRALNRIRSLLTQIHPALERVFASGSLSSKNALFYSAWVASTHDSASKASYQRKRPEGKRHNAAVICLARRRCNVIFAMLRDGIYYQPPTPVPAPRPSRPRGLTRNIGTPPREIDL